MSQNIFEAISRSIQDNTRPTEPILINDYDDLGWFASVALRQTAADLGVELGEAKKQAIAEAREVVGSGVDRNSPEYAIAVGLLYELDQSNFDHGLLSGLPKETKGRLDAVQKTLCKKFLVQLVREINTFSAQGGVYEPASIELSLQVFVERHPHLLPKQSILLEELSGIWDDYYRDAIEKAGVGFIDFNDGHQTLSDLLSLANDYRVGDSYDDDFVPSLAHPERDEDEDDDYGGYR